MPQDKILLHGLVFYGHHGVLSAEQELGQKFVLDVELCVELADAGTSDDLSKTIDYSQVYAVVREVVQERRFRLLESLAETVAQSLLEGFPLREVRVRIKKPHVPIKGPLDYVGVEIVRTRPGSHAG